MHFSGKDLTVVTSASHRLRILLGNKIFKDVLRSKHVQWFPTPYLECLLESKMLHPECFFFFFFLFHLCSRWEGNGARAHANMLHSRVSQQHQFLHVVTRIPCYALFFFILHGPLRAKGGRGRRWKKEPCGLCRLSVCADRLKGGPGLLSQQRTTHLLSRRLLGLITESKHSGSVILLVSQGRLLIQFSPQHCTAVWDSGGGSGGKKKKNWKKKTVTERTQGNNVQCLKMCVSVAPKLMNVLH